MFVMAGRARELLGYGHMRRLTNGGVDPFNLRERFVQTQRQTFALALREINAGRKRSHWSWFVWPTPPHLDYCIFRGLVEAGSAMNRHYALRDPPPNQLSGDRAARAFLLFPETDGVCLRANYITMMHAVAEQLEAGVPAMTLAGRTDLPKLKSSLLLFERVSRRGDVDSHMACQRALQALGVEVGAGTLPQPHDS